MKKYICKLIIFSMMVLVFLGFSKNIYTNAYAQNTLTNYKINVSFDEAKKVLRGTENIKYTNNYSEALDSLVIHLYPDCYSSLKTRPIAFEHFALPIDNKYLGNIKLLSVKINGKAVNYTDKNQILKIKLDTPLAIGDKISVDIGFEDKIPEGTNRMGYMNGVYSFVYWYPIMSIYDPITHSWDENAYYPVGESNYSDVANYDVTIQAPKDQVIATPDGTITSSINKDTKIVNITSQNMRDFVFIMSSFFKSVTTTVDGVKINSYYMGGNQFPGAKIVAKAILDAVADSLHFYNNAFGKYPYKQLSVVETYLSSGCMEYPSLIQMRKYNYYTTATARQDFLSNLIGAAVHETGHQWWYVAVGDNEYKEPMMDEALTVFSAAFYFDKRHGKYDQNGSLFTINRTVGYFSNQYTMPIASPVNVFSGISDYQIAIYGRGPQIFEDIRVRLGDDKMLKVLSTYFSRYEFKNGTIKDFEEVLGEIGGSDIESYFDASIHSKTYCPNNLKLTPQIQKYFSNMDNVSTFKSLEKNKGVIFSSLLLRGMDGEKTYIVVPSKISKTQQKTVTNYANKLKAYFDSYFIIPIKIIKDTSVTTAIAKENLIVMGNQYNNSFLSSSKTILLVKQNKTNVSFKGYKLPTKNLNIKFIVRNPKASKKIILVYYFTDRLILKNIPEDYSGDNITNYQYIIDYGDSNTISG